MERNKYYTPTIEEFHVGFQYEYNSGKWDKHIILDQNHLIYAIADVKSTRVKYLDKENIESLGIITNEWFINKGRYGGTYKLQVSSFVFAPKITIKIKDFIRNGIGDYEEFTIIHRLPIKNKSELIRLLNQLGINK